MEITLLQTRGFEVYHAIISPPKAKHHLSEGMRHAVLYHTEMAGELNAFGVVMSSAMESVLRCSPSDTAHIELVGELVTEFCKVEGRCLRLEWPAARI
jgi:hypothetical protein